MNRMSWLVAVSVVCSVPSGVLAGSSAYVTSGPMAGTVRQCLSGMKSIADRSGFALGQETLLDNNGMAGDFHANSQDSSLHFTARCNAVTRTWGIALSGADSKQAFARYRSLYPLLP